MERVKRLLDEQGLPYELIPHDQPIRSAREGASLLGIEIGQTAPALILETDKGHVALIVSGKRGRLDFAQMAPLLGFRQLKMAGATEVKRITGYEPGSVPLVGYDLPVVLDDELFSYPFVYGGAGDPLWTLKLSPQALEQASRVVARLPRETGGK
ncbi:aminoacyl-tRNA deacylase [Brevibacillus thermoruber]|uniref:aminoacyl-tRNA deacylase n=1 Tax=Brevibacillus thermoruber TaxID=33942 RepID=UPI00055721E1|nr:YbaK/EbsC family protein [Brevibacillus thermoruber]